VAVESETYHLLCRLFEDGWLIVTNSYVLLNDIERAILYLVANPREILA
jgi:hypothetical protein